VMRVNNFFSVIIPAFGKVDYIGECIKSVKAKDRIPADYEIIVSDGGMTEKMVKTVRLFDVTIVRNNAKSSIKTIGALRNIGTRECRGTVFAFLDADMVVPDDWLVKAAEYFNGGFVGALGFIQTVPPQAGWVGKTWDNRIYHKTEKVTDVDFLPGGNLFVNRVVFEKINGFNETLRTGEDKDLTLRVLKAGYRVVSVPDISVIHLGYDRTLREFLRKEFWRQGNTLLFARQWGYSFRTLRNPLLSLWHILLLCSVLLSILLLRYTIVSILIFVWFLPSIFITIKKVNRKSPISFYISFFTLTFLRWNVAGLSIVKQIFEGTHE
jgi:cellulose synthase/poly-beta-1,6-N-acetylglucosamine synthase-like glycosyltransferase